MTIIKSSWTMSTCILFVFQWIKDGKCITNKLYSYSNQKTDV